MNSPPGVVRVRRLQVLLIKPSKYDDDGYVMRFVRGVLPSNTLATLAALTREVAASGTLAAPGTGASVEVGVEMMDETVQRIDVGRIARKYLRPGIRPVVALCGVQTNQFPRAADLARRFHDAGMPAMIGGFHVSGAIAMSADGSIPPECRSLMDDGITLVKGEVEERWGEILQDALDGRLRPFYDIAEPPDLSRASIPVVDPRLMKRFAYPNMGTIDAGRGCPFHCSFCSIINVQGRKMRTRLASTIADRIRENVRLSIDYYFFTDDNFSRNPRWEEVFDALIGLRAEGIPIHFMMQVDVIASRIPRFVEKAKAAGCTQIFLGMETVNPANLGPAGKPQNKVEEYRSMIQTWHANGIACHVGYIIGFPHDTLDSVRDDIRRLRDELQVDQASFFMLTPIPGSRDHRDLVASGGWMEEDYNRFDSFHATTRHPLMTDAEWNDAYRFAWREFYTVGAMKGVLARADRENYWGLFKNFAWYRYAIQVEDTHPMISGFVRLKDRRDRRPGFAVESRLAHARRRTREMAQWARRVVPLYFEMQEVWLATRSTSRPRRKLRRPTRADLDAYWVRTFSKIRRGRVFQINPFALAINALRDAVLCARFNISIMSGYGK